MLKCLLYSRLQTGLVSNKEYYDEDVNVYMAHLLQASSILRTSDRIRLISRSTTPMSSQARQVEWTRA